MVKKLLTFITIFFLAKPVYSVNYKDYIPPKAYQYKNILLNEIATIFPELPEYNYVPSLIEHESCISLTHSRCWSPTSQLKTEREEGAGLFQITRAYYSDGTLRFDTLQAMRDRYKDYLRELSWKNVYQRPDLQIRLGILLIKDLYYKLAMIEDEYERLKFVDSAYNGGLEWTYRERRACSLARNCNENIWFDNVEKYCLKSKKILYGRRSACDINRDHTKDVFLYRLPKYKKYYFTKEDIQNALNTR